MIDRRTLLMAGASGLAACATSATPDAVGDAEFRALLERIAQADPRERLVAIAAFDERRLSPGGRILFEAVAPGALAESLIVAFPWAQGSAPYAVTHRAGAYRNANPDAREIERETAAIEAAAAAGVIAPDFVLDAAISSIDARAARFGGDVAAAMGRQSAVLSALRARAPTEAGLWAQPGGETYYEMSLHMQLGEAVAPRDAHHRALAACQALQSEADTLLRARGLTDGSVAERLRAFAADERQLYADNAEGKAQAVADMNAALARVRSPLSAVLPGGDVAAEVRPVPQNMEAGGAAGRREGNLYFVDLGRARPRWTLASVAYHELVPGHITQAAFEREAHPPALQVRYAGGYSEGWAIYAENLADLLGMYGEDPASRIGYLQWMLFRFGRVVADTGIHALRWSRERAISELRALQGDSIAFVSIEDDVLRMCAQPGALAAQGLAALRLIDLRDRYWRRPGFSLARFHDAVLRHGPLSPPGLAQALRVEFGA
ncbi:MAG: DUF885 family protein [Hyphomonadaceae bacterium]